jgi:large subunit ribosomal protein L30
MIMATEKTTTAKPKAAAAPKAAKPAAKAAPDATKTAKTTQTGPAVTVTQTKSSAGRIKSQQATLTGLGLGRIGKTRTLQATPAVQGMIDKVAHLIKVS